MHSKPWLESMKILHYLPLLLLTALTAGCDKKVEAGLQGYAEGEYVRVAAPFAGNLENLQVRRGGQVKTGDPLFTLEQANEERRDAKSAERLRNAEAQSADLEKAAALGNRSGAAQLDQARATLKLAEVNLHRQEQLVAANFVSKAAVESACNGRARAGTRCRTRRASERPCDCARAGRNTGGGIQCGSGACSAGTSGLEARAENGARPRTGACKRHQLCNR